MSPSKPPAKKASVLKAPKVRQTSSQTPKKSPNVNFKQPDDPPDDIEELIGSLGATFLDRGENWKRAGYMKTRVIDGEQYTYYQQRVDIFVGYPLTYEDVEVRLLNCGNFVFCETKIPAWFGSSKHFGCELRSNNPNRAIPVSDSEFLAMTATAQEISQANPDMDAKQLAQPTQKIPLSFRCKEPFLNLRIITLPCKDVTVGGARTYYFLVSFYLQGVQELLQRKRQAGTAGTHIDSFADLYD